MSHYPWGRSQGLHKQVCLQNASGFQFWVFLELVHNVFKQTINSQNCGSSPEPYFFSNTTIKNSAESEPLTYKKESTLLHERAPRKQWHFKNKHKFFPSHTSTQGCVYAKVTGTESLSVLFSSLQLKQCVWYCDLNLSPDSKVIHFLSKSYIQKSKKERKNNHPPSYHPDWPVPLNVQSDNDPDPHIPGYIPWCFTSTTHTKNSYRPSRFSPKTSVNLT